MNKVLNFTPTSENALDAQKNGNLNSWVQELLKSEGNLELADSLLKEKTIAIEIYYFPLSKLTKIVGPEENEEHRQPPDVWERKVSKIAQMVKEGFRPAPLIVTDFWNHFEIADGNHRQEAMLRAGMTHYWTIFFVKYQKGLQYLQSIEKN